MKRVWVYLIEEEVDSEKLTQIENDLAKFIEEWNAHGQLLMSSANILYNRFIVLKVDESVAEASGCSIDSSTRFLKELERKYNISLFNRGKMAYFNEGKIATCNLSDIAHLYHENIISDASPVFNLSIINEDDLSTEWEQPFAESGYKRFV